METRPSAVVVSCCAAAGSAVAVLNCAVPGSCVENRPFRLQSSSKRILAFPPVWPDTLPCLLLYQLLWAVCIVGQVDPDVREAQSSKIHFSPATIRLKECKDHDVVLCDAFHS